MARAGGWRERRRRLRWRRRLGTGAGGGGEWWRGRRLGLAELRLARDDQVAAGGRLAGWPTKLATGARAVRVARSGRRAGRMADRVAAGGGVLARAAGGGRCAEPGLKPD
ncbi:MAG: hypothetical protein LBL83_00550 [Clostridiales bacterium]|nr:hypothetical protein [Clostridiales bacterium]